MAFGSIFDTIKSGLNSLGSVASVALGLGKKSIQYYIDSHFREHVVPVEGSAVYSDLYFAVEHSGIYVGDGQIANIVVDDLLMADSTVRLSDAQDFTQKSKLGKKIYVSCQGTKAVGSHHIADQAMSHIGDKNFYGLIFSNCHSFSTKCLAQDFTSQLTPSFDIAFVKFTAKRVLQANKWRLWDWDNSAKETPEPNWQKINQDLKQRPLTPKYRQELQKEIEQTQAYEQEIADENIPKNVLDKLVVFRTTLQKVAKKYDEVAPFLKLFPQAGFSYEQLEALADAVDFTALAKQIQNNQKIQSLVKKMGRAYIDEEKKRQIKVPKASKSEVHGTYHSDDIMRMLPSELVNLEDGDLEMVFYAKLLEKNLITYQLDGITHISQEESYQEPKQTTGPVIACLDTSASMMGEPMLKAKALLFAIASILKQEKRSLYVLLFGASGQLKEYRLTGAEDLSGLLTFLHQSFGGGTDFETPLQKAIQIIETQQAYIKADVLMISDGDCQVSANFAHILNNKKIQLNYKIYSVLCHGYRVEDGFSDEVVVL